ncbi:MAG: beta-lactamase family protein [Deltaproteobacteria bacterium]|nr:beta-lactamase family protein [Deltaproteobacteria bacterium]
MNPLSLLAQLPIPGVARCHIPRDLGEVTTIGPEENPREARTPRAAVERIWNAVEALYRSGIHPAIQVCIRRHGVPILHRAIGHSHGNAPGDAPDGPKQVVGLDTPFTLYSASKAVTAMVIHKLDELRVFHLEDRVCDYVPEFDREGKRWITIHHVLTHRAGIPNVPPEAMNLDLLDDPRRVIGILARMPRTSRPGAFVQYHAVSGGFVLAEVVRRATGESIAAVLEREICKPLGFRWMRYGVRPDDLPLVAHDALTGPPILPPVSNVFRRALGASMPELLALARDPRFLTGVVPSANVVSNAWEIGAFYECLLQNGTLGGARVFDPHTVRHATNEQSYREIDLTLLIPLRYGSGLMLGDRPFGIFGPNTPRAFGHLGFTNIFCWADPVRQISVAVLTSGKPVLSAHVIPLLALLMEINRLPASPAARGA